MNLCVVDVKGSLQEIAYIDSGYDFESAMLGSL